MSCLGCYLKRNLSAYGGSLIREQGGPVSYDGDAFSDWRQRAACKGVDPDLFCLSEADDLGFGGVKLHIHDRNKFAEAVKYCRKCPVSDECYREGLSENDHIHTVRGGRTPHDVPVQYSSHPLATPPEVVDELWMMYVRNVPREEIIAHAGVNNMPKRLKKMYAAAASGPETAWWDVYVRPDGYVVRPGAGWIQSVSADGSLIMALVRGARSGKIRRTVIERRKAVIDNDVVTSELPELDVPHLYQERPVPA